jgi:hypothetical protein
MSCHICGCSTGCNCSPSLCGSQDCEDPGMIPVGSHLPILDYKLCERRLENVQGFLVCDFVPGGTPQIFFTAEPCITLPEIGINVGDQISHMVASMGDNGCLRRLLPDPEADGWLRAIGGTWVLSALPSESFPEPFEVENLIVNDTATIENLVVGASMCFDALPAGTIATFVGLNAENCLVTGAISQIEASLYYESATLTSALEPNNPTARNTNVIIGNEIFDPQSISSVVSPSRVKIDKAGSYFIFWSAFFDHGDGEGANGRPSLDLVINGSIVALGCGRRGHVNNPSTVPVEGFHLATLAINDTIDLKTNNTANVTNNILMDVKLMLVKYRT